ncbi:MAG TPA: heme exporter protein CcmD [Gammaproteobacteria bacterium]|nr:heme exporter protein CcmD [Gammaproteobacteria bacterium]
MSEFFHMGGYAFYVWGSYLLTFIVLLLNIIMPVRQEQKLLREIAQRARAKRSAS